MKDDLLELLATVAIILVVLGAIAIVFLRPPTKVEHIPMRLDGTFVNATDKVGELHQSAKELHRLQNEMNKVIQKMNHTLDDLGKVTNKRED